LVGVQESHVDVDDDLPARQPLAPFSM